MRNLTEAELLNVWEKCMDWSLIGSSLHLLATASSSTDLSGVASLSIGQRDVRLLQLREWMFGSRLKNTAECPNCRQIIEWENEVKDLHLQALVPEIHTIFEAEIDQYYISFRLPTSNDLMSLKEVSPVNFTNELLRRCLAKIEKDNREVNFYDLPANIIEEINISMSRKDPQADISMLLTCPSCTTEWEAGFDILTYLWAEINAWSKQTLGQIFILAKYFGWSEGEILALGPRRRQWYLEMVRA